jgi:acyl dehydratase
MSEELWTYDRFAPGELIGEATLTLDAERFERWRRLFPSAEGATNAPPGLLMALLMEGYMAAIQPRPPGNIHAGQKLTFAGKPLAEGGRVTVSISCNAKELKRERRFVRFGASMRDARGEEILAGEMNVIWAA